MNEQITKLDPYEFLKSNIVYTDVKKAVLTENIDQSTEDTYGSEKSYDVLVSHEDFLDIITFMTAKPLWNYVVAFANLFEYCIATYALAFDDTINREISILVARCICILMVVADIIFALLHYRWKEIRQRRIEPPRNKYLQIIDAITLISIFLIYMPFLGGLFIRKVICVILISIRLYRILIYYRRVSTTAGMNTKSYLLMKHGLIYVFIIHSFACLWKHEGMGSKELKETWMHKDSYLTTTKEQTVSNFNLYILSLLYVVGAVTSVAFGGGSALKNDTEKMILICLMLISFFYLYGMCLGSFTLVQVEKYRRQTQFINRFKMIVNNLEAHNISKVLRNKMLRYYVQFWKQDDAISHSTLFDKLPLAIRQQVLLDKFWFAIDEIHIFKYLHPGFKCKLACHMTARICIPGESIYNVGETCHKMIYIAKGSVNLLSTVDGQSPLLTLGVGTTLGKFNLVYSMKSSSNVVAATYCTIYILERRVLWKQISTYKQLLQAKIMHVNIKRIINQARAYHKQKEDTNDTHEYNLLQETKRMLRTENEYHIIDYTAKTSSDRRDKLSYIYVLSKRSNMNTDGIFIQTTWPWILNNESAFIDAWEICVVAAVLVCCIGYPYEIAFNRGFSNEYTLYRVLGDIIYLADVVIKLITAIETDQGLLTTSVQIGLNRLSQLSFLCDVLAIFPFHSLTYYSGISKQQRYLIILSALKLFKFYRIIGYLQKLEYNFKLNIAYIRLLKYVMFLLYPGYLMGCLYFMVLCFNEPCAQDMALANKTQNAVSYSIMTAMLIMSGTGGIVEFFSIQEVSIILSVSITGTLTIVYLVADYSATLTLAEREITMYSEMVSLMRKFMVTNNIVKQLQLRMNRYLIARWLDCKGMNYKDLYQDASKQLFEDFQIKKYSKILYTNPLFQHLHFNIIRKLAISCQSVSLPPNEYVCYAGEVSREMYIIENGYCELISGSSEMVEKILGPMNGFCIVDTLLELAGIFNVRTITHVRLLKLRLTSIKEALLIVPEMAQQVNELSEETRSSFVIILSSHVYKLLSEEVE